MELRFTETFEVEYRKLVRGNVLLRKKVQKQLSRLQQDAKHPSLRLHKLGFGGYWSVSVDKSIRMLIIIEKRWIYVYHIGKHEDVY